MKSPSSSREWIARTSGTLKSQTTTTDSRYRLPSEASLLRSIDKNMKNQVKGCMSGRISTLYQLASQWSETKRTQILIFSCLRVRKRKSTEVILSLILLLVKTLKKSVGSATKRSRTWRSISTIDTLPWLLRYPGWPLQPQPTTIRDGLSAITVQRARRVFITLSSTSKSSKRKEKT